jgi:hypothetical protein
MNNLTEFQNNLILDLQKEFTRLNPPKVESSGRFSLAAVKQDIDNVKAFKDSIFKYNQAIALELQKNIKTQIEEFNKEFDPIILTGFLDYHDMFGNGTTRRADTDYYIRNPHSAQLQLFLIGKTDHVAVYVIYTTEIVTIKTSCETINLFKITGIQWTKRGYLYRQEDTHKYPTLDEYTQNQKDFQYNITAMYKNLTK